MCVESFDRPLKKIALCRSALAYKGNEFKSLPGRLGRARRRWLLYLASVHVVFFFASCSLNVLFV